MRRLLLGLAILAMALPADAAQQTTLTCSLQTTASATVGGATASLPISYTKTWSLANGTGANQAQTVYANFGATIALSSSTTLDLAGVLTDFTGTVITFTKIKAIVVYAAAGNTNDVVVGGVGANAFVTPFGSTTDKVNVKPGGMIVLPAPDVNGYAVTAGTGDLLKITNGGAGTSVTYDIIIIGV